ncbi:RraA family protein [Rhodococcoides kyotonense]|uniref:Putative 4-hydroxy-4-methyl-2-oxoglutarate aldolase n=1 Tax=Rhodococcoides kyotonense TaxID=398843 RepID=A0A239NG52_9NOCA|nr:RraA family protein [Rhodococcus kyotonensis]SNT53384.1 Regulator of RNase E activity RraA [Rhodococcus kyotonensis]
MTQYDRATVAADIARLTSIPDVSAAVADALDALGIEGAAIALAPLERGHRAIGPAVTLAYVALPDNPASNRRAGIGTSLFDRELFDGAAPGDVAVIVCPPEPVCAVMGSISAHWAALAGLAGCVVDGAVRDSNSILATNLPVWSATRAPIAGRYRLAKKSLGERVTVAGVFVDPGDIVVADDDGICVVPQTLLGAVTDLCLEGDRVERSLLATIAASTSTTDLRRRLSDVPPDVVAR